MTTRRPKQKVKPQLKTSHQSKNSNAPTSHTDEEEVSHIIPGTKETPADSEENEETKASINESKQLPLLFIDIHLDDKDVHRLTIHDGDQPDELADKFCSKFNIDGEMKMKLTDLIKTQMDNLLTRIDETEEEW